MFWRKKSGPVDHGPMHCVHGEPLLGHCDQCRNMCTWPSMYYPPDPYTRVFPTTMYDEALRRMLEFEANQRRSKGMITATVQSASECFQKPFLWRQDSGCVYLRNIDGSDIIIAPNQCDEKVGKVVTMSKTDRQAWARRLLPDETVTLANGSR